MVAKNSRRDLHFAHGCHWRSLPLQFLPTFPGSFHRATFPRRGDNAPGATLFLANEFEFCRKADLAFLPVMTAPLTVAKRPALLRYRTHKRCTFGADVIQTPFTPRKMHPGGRMFVA